MNKEIKLVPIATIKPDPTQPRKDFKEEDIKELAQSIKRSGLLNPIIVKKVEGGYIIIAGERRYRAHQMLGADTIECAVYNGSNGKELQLVENVNRKDLNYMELAAAYRSYLDSNHNIKELGEVIGKPKNTITWVLNLEKCREEVQALVRKGHLSLVVAISLSKLTGNGQLRVLRMMQQAKLSIIECQNLCDKIYLEENQGDMFVSERKLTEEELKARGKIKSALERACQALQEVNKLEMDNPGISAQAVAEKLDITEEKVDMLYKLLGRFKKNLRQQRVATLC